MAASAFCILGLIQMRAHIADSAAVIMGKEVASGVCHRKKFLTLEKWI